MDSPQDHWDREYRDGTSHPVRPADWRVWEGECESGEEWLRHWLARGDFVMWWSRDLWVDGDGRIYAT